MDQVKHIINNHYSKWVQYACFLQVKHNINTVKMFQKTLGAMQAIMLHLAPRWLSFFPQLEQCLVKQKEYAIL
jgi:hypothetical protein